MDSVKQLNDALRHAIERTARQHEDIASTLRRVQAAIPEASETAATVEAAALLSRFGFRVVHVDQLDAAIACVAAAEGNNCHEQERIEKLLDYLEKQRLAADCA